ncbi:DNA cytosine methyltransferase [uncultured Akkermansia sp.]|uniref:DNA cytosine methyltransferase n=1 Tax=uncultured Akkermansia sp. TaxID=512294 RepID=UPI0025E05180|nr:DNA cytosine methyltransferase [uncultured Akkermansia sp.]
MSSKLTRPKLKAIDFFCGGGGMTCGLRQAGIDVLAGVDNNLKCRETYERNNAPAKFIGENITELPLNYFTNHFGIQPWDDSLILVGCSPCQYYSIINTDKNKALLSRNLLMDFLGFVRQYMPGYVLVENVPGILTKKDTVWHDFKFAMRKLGYYFDYHILDLSYYGVPQSRKRFSFIASRLDHNVTLPPPDNRQAVLKDFIGEKNGFPAVPAGYRDNSDFNHTVAALSDVTLERLRHTRHDGGSRSDWANIPHLQLKCFVGRDDCFIDTFGRMRWDKPASTITTRFTSVSNGRFAHPDEDRGISLREGATLQTFPKNYVFVTSSMTEMAKMIGNAVPPEYARRLGETIKALENNGTI